MKQKLLYYTIIVSLFMSNSSFGQTEIFNISGGGTFPAGWNGVNNIASQPIDKGDYYLVQPGNTGDLLVTTLYDLSAYATATFEVNIKSYGSGTHRSLKVEVSTDGGSNYTQSFTTPVTTTTYTTQIVNIPVVNGNMVLRLSVNSTSGRGIRMQNLVFTALGTPTPTITTSTASLTGFDYVVGSGPSAEQTFTVEGTNLTNDILVTAPTNFEISTSSGTGFGTSVNLPQSSGVVGTTTIYTRLSSGLAINTYAGDITATSTGATTQDVSLSGEVTAVNTDCVDESFTSTTFAPTNWLVSNVTRSTTSSDYNTSPAAAKYGSTNGYLTTDVISNPTSLSFYLGRSSNTSVKTFNVKVSTTSQTGPFTTVSVFNHSNVSSGTYNQYTVDLSAYNSNSNVWIQFEKVSSTTSPWRFDDVKVTCGVLCSHTVTNFTPTSGPENTEVTINGTGFTASTTVAFNGAAATIISQTSTEIKVLVPSGTSTGAITITETSCDVISADFTFIDTKNTSCQGSVSASDLFISEVTDATSGSLTYIEIYNGTGSDIADLSNYSLEIRFNAGGTTQTITLSGALADGDVHVVRTSLNTTCPGSEGQDGSYADQNESTNGIDVGKNDSDCITLFKGTNSIDFWGDCNDKDWRITLGVAIGTEGFDFRRLITAVKPKDPDDYPNSPFTDYNFSPSDWEIIDWEDDSCDDDYSDIGSYSNGTPPYILSQSYNPPTCSDDAVLTVTGYEGYDDVGDTKELAYQWYVVAPGVATWTALSDSVPYSGSTTNELTISDTSTLDGYQYYCQVRENDADCYQATNTILIETTSISTNWNGSLPWSNGTPTSDTVVILNSDYDTTTDGSFSCCSLTLSDDVVLDIDADDSYVSIENDLTVNDGAILNVENKASLVMVYDYGNVTLIGTGIVNVNKQSTPYELYDYTYWSSPIVDETVGDALSGSYADRIYYYNGANYYDALDANGDPNPDGFDDDGDDWVQVGASDVMSPGRGYAAMGNISAPSYSHTQYATFSGKVNNGIVTELVSVRDIPSTGAAEGFDYSLVGNPYPSAIDADEFIMQNPNISGTLYFWTHIDDISADYPGPDAQNFHPDDYASYNLTGGVATVASSTSGSNAPTGKIGSGQGFIVEVNNTGNVTFNNSMRKVTHSNSQFFKTSAPSSSTPIKDRMWINLTNPDGAFNQALIGFFENATHGYDNYYDGTFLGGGTHVSLYSLIDGNAFNIQGKPTFRDTYKIPLGFDSRILVPLTISIYETEGILSDIPVYLIDNQLDIVHNLKESDYKFKIKEIGTYNDRFEIVFKDPSIIIDDTIISDEIVYTDLIIANQSETILVKYLDEEENTISHVKAYDVLGRLLIDRTTNENELNIVSNTINAGTVLFFKIQLSNGEVLSQKFIKL